MRSYQFFTSIITLTAMYFLGRIKEMHQKISWVQTITHHSGSQTKLDKKAQSARRYCLCYTWMIWDCHRIIRWIPLILKRSFMNNITNKSRNWHNLITAIHSSRSHLIYLGFPQRSQWEGYMHHVALGVEQLERTQDADNHQVKRHGLTKK